MVVNRSQYNIASAMPKANGAYVYGANLRVALIGSKKGKIPKGTYGAMLGDMVGNGWVKTKPCKQSKRNKYYTLTVKGKNAIRKYEKGVAVR